MDKITSLLTGQLPPGVQVALLIALALLWVTSEILSMLKQTRYNGIVQMLLVGIVKVFGARDEKLAALAKALNVAPKPSDDLTPAESPAARTKQAGFVRLGVLLAVAALGLTITCLAACKTTYGAAYGTCVKASTTNWPAMAAKIPAQVESIMAEASAGETVAATLEALGDAYQDGGFLVSCALTAWTQTHPLAGDGGLPTPKLLAAHAGAIKFLAAHPAAAKRAASCRTAL